MLDFCTEVRNDAESENGVKMLMDVVLSRITSKPLVRSQPLGKWILGKKDGWGELVAGKVQLFVITHFKAMADQKSSTKKHGLAHDAGALLPSRHT